MNFEEYLNETIEGDMVSKSDVWFIAYPEGADKAYLLQQKVRAL